MTTYARHRQPRNGLGSHAIAAEYVESNTGDFVPAEAAPRPLCNIAVEIRRTWKNPYFGAVPYLNAMLTLERMTDSFGLDPADEIVRYFLANARTWRGDTARRIKEELKSLLGE